MRFTSACMAAGLLALAVAHPVEKRADTLPPVDSAMDESVVQLALYLEHLEFVLYSSGYDNFTDAEYTAAGFPVGFRENVGVIAQVRTNSCTASSLTKPARLICCFQHEQTHADTLSAILTKAGYTPVPPCTYKFPFD